MMRPGAEPGGGKSPRTRLSLGPVIDSNAALPPTADPAHRDPRHNIASWISHWAAAAGDRVALVFEGRSYDYREFDDHVARLARLFSERNVSAGDRVALLLDNHPAYLAAVFASARIGAIALPINTRLAPGELAFIVRDASPQLVLVDDRGAALVDRFESQSGDPAPTRIVVARDANEWLEVLATLSPRTENTSAHPDDAMMLMYSSGTTGTPKGALLPHRKALYNSLNARTCSAIDPNDRCLVVAPLFHSLGLHILSIPVFHSGGCVVLRAGFDAEHVLESIEREQITYMGGVPTHYERMLECMKQPNAKEWDLTSLKFMFGAGAAVSPNTIRAFAEFGLVLKQGYGQTETSMLCCLEEEDALRKAGTVGRPLEHLELRVVAPESLAEPSTAWRDVTASTDDVAGEVGEIVVRGPITMLGYWRNEAGTRETLRDGWVLTGDLARVDSEGFITLVGRSREMFISGGENVYPAEIEAAYLKHPDIAEIAVAARTDEKWGEVGLAFVVMNSGAQFDAGALVAWGSEMLARFKIPREFHEVNELPKTGSGKVQKHKLVTDLVGTD